ncbi:MAG: enoyl-CoA hydratase/isomerase family protein [candidate division Zixibacteria bacterium]|nr:enoyl-CoA hydratase/isomerase family protein [candidate division Zixibacteria bacterium]
MPSHILCDIQDSIAAITINRPEKLNALADSMRGDLLATIQRADANPAVRVITITGAGRAFCAGGDIGYLRDLKSQNDEAGFVRLLDEGKAVVKLLRESGKPTLAIVNGPAYGAGFFISIACDLRLCGESASFAAPFVKLGLGPDWGGTYMLPRMIGTSASLEMLFTGEAVSSHDALRLGLANRVWPDADLRARARAFALALAGMPSEVLARHKRAIYHTMDGSFETTADLERRFQLENFRSPASTEGITAFLEKRPPKF